MGVFPGFLRGVPGFFRGVPDFLGVFPVFLRVLQVFWGCSGLLRDVPMFLEVLNPILNSTVVCLVRHFTCHGFNSAASDMFQFTKITLARLA